MSPRTDSSWKGALVADVLFIALTIAAFGVLVAVLRGVARL
jgi:hypothetical protein